jgi:hypothetical protein
MIVSTSRVVGKSFNIFFPARPAYYPSMFISASFRTDIPAHYGAWFLRRLEAGFAMVSNPWTRRSREPRAGEADGFVF